MAQLVSHLFTRGLASDTMTMHPMDSASPLLTTPHDILGEPQCLQAAAFNSTAARAADGRIVIYQVCHCCCAEHICNQSVD